VRPAGQEALRAAAGRVGSCDGGPRSSLGCGRLSRPVCSLQLTGIGVKLKLEVDSRPPPWRYACRLCLTCLRRCVLEVLLMAGYYAGHRKDDRSQSHSKSILDHGVFLSGHQHLGTFSAVMAGWQNHNKTGFQDVSACYPARVRMPLICKRWKM